MLDHMTFRVSDLDRSKAFYSAILAPLGYTLDKFGNFDGMKVLGFSHSDSTHPEGRRSDVWLVDGRSPYGNSPVSTSCHICWRADSRAQVDAFHRAAMTVGAKDYGSPGLRPHYSANYYAAFVIDPDGNNLEAVCRLPE